GHDHFYERMVINDFAYIINGLGGKSLNSFGPKIPGSLVRYNADYGAVLAQASETHLNFKFINSSGQIIDSFTFVRP
ncbi:MAG: alkaline phosphatase, partial [Anaerolineae bacterium]|nr:alkaline phosphatase [Anaerolineae bacterium]